MTCRRTFTMESAPVECVDSYLVPDDCVNYFLTNTTESSSDFTWDPVDHATGYNVYRAPESDPLNFVLTETNIPVSVLSIDCEWVKVTALILDWESPVTCDPIHFCVAEIEIDTTLLPVAFRFFEFGTSYNTITTMELDYPSISVPFPIPATPPPTDFTRSLHASGGVPPYTWSIESGILPEGLSLNSSSGLISGIPLPLTPPQRVPNIADLNRAVGRIASLYPVVFKCQDAIANVAYSSQTIIVNWVVRVVGSGDMSFADGIIVIHPGAAADGNIIGNFWWNIGPGVGNYVKVNNLANLDFWASEGKNGVIYSPTDSPRPIADLLGVYNVANGLNTGSFTLS